MMQISVSTVLGLIVFLYGVRTIAIHWKRHQLARRHGCEPIANFPITEVFGRDFEREVGESFRNGSVNHTALQHYRRAGSQTYRVKTPAGDMLYTADPRNHQVIATNMEHWVRESGQSGSGFFGVNQSITHQSGSAWKKSRSLIMPLFQRAELRQLQHFGKFVDILIGKIPRDGTTVDMQPLLRKLFLDSSTEFIFGESIGSLNDDSGYSDEFIVTFNRAAAGAGKRLNSTGLRQKFYSLGTRDEAWQKDCRVIHDYVDQCITRCQDRMKSRMRPSNRYVLIEGMLLEASNPIDLRYQLLGIFSLARETSAMAFSNVLFLLARHPHIWAELRAQALALDMDQLTFEGIQASSYFRNVILETFRLHSPVTRIRRVSACDTVLPRGGGPTGSAPALVPRGAHIWCDRFPKFQDPELWGDDVKAFQPSRFEGRSLGAWDFLPFSGGPRMCPANQQVINQCMYSLVRMTREFEKIENRDPCLEFVEGVTLCFESRNGCRVAFT